VRGIQPGRLAEWKHAVRTATPAQQLRARWCPQVKRISYIYASLKALTNYTQNSTYFKGLKKQLFLAKRNLLPLPRQFYRELPLKSPHYAVCQPT